MKQWKYRARKSINLKGKEKKPEGEHVHPKDEERARAMVGGERASEQGAVTLGGT